MNRYVVKLVPAGHQMSFLAECNRSMVASMLRGAQLAKTDSRSIELAHGKPMGEIAFRTNHETFLSAFKLELSNYGLTVERED